MSLLSPEVQELYERVLLQMEEHPYRTMAASAGLGFVLSGGLLSGMGKNAIRTALRLGLADAINPMLRDFLDRTRPA